MLKKKESSFPEIPQTVLLLFFLLSHSEPSKE